TGEPGQGREELAPEEVDLAGGASGRREDPPSRVIPADEDRRGDAAVAVRAGQAVAEPGLRRDRVLLEVDDGRGQRAGYEARAFRGGSTPTRTATSARRAASARGAAAAGRATPAGGSAAAGRATTARGSTAARAGIDGASSRAATARAAGQVRRTAAGAGDPQDAEQR